MICVTERAEGMRAEIDAVIFDMDGVLIDMTGSIRVVNCLAVPFYLRECLGWPAPDDLLTSDDIELFKNAGGFNDDWDLTYALVLHFLVKGHDRPDDPPATLKVLPPSLRRYASLIQERGGGLKVAESICLGPLSRADQDVIERAYHKTKIRKVFQELMGGEHCERLYGFAPTMYHGSGWINKDRPLLDLSKLPTNIKIGVQTGRTRAEANFGLEMVGVGALVDTEYVVTKDDGFQKPHPGGLLALTKRMGIKRGIYIGDTIDDLRTVQNFNKAATHASFLAAQVLTGPAGDANEKAFRKAGADVVAANVNAALDWLLGVVVQ